MEATVVVSQPLSPVVLAEQPTLVKANSAPERRSRYSIEISRQNLLLINDLYMEVNRRFRYKVPKGMFLNAIIARGKPNLVKLIKHICDSFTENSNEDLREGMRREFFNCSLTPGNVVICRNLANRIGDRFNSKGVSVELNLEGITNALIVTSDVEVPNLVDYIKKAFQELANTF